MTKKEFNEFVDSFGKDAGEFTEDELYQIGVKFKELPVSEKRWDDLVQMLGIEKTGETFRQWIKGRQYAENTIVRNEHMLSGQTVEELTFPEFEDKVETLKANLYKQQVKTRDTMAAYRKTLRDEARIETMVDAISGVVNKLQSLPEIDYSPCANTLLPDNEAVLLLSDLHIGAQIKSFCNNYNVEIAKKRLNKLVDDTISLCLRNNVQRLNVLGLGDFIHGIIHVSARLEQELDVIEQVMIASEMIADALNRLQEAAPELIYRSCLDNHSRCTPNLKEHIEKENLGRLIDFYLKERLRNTNVVFMEDNLDPDIGMFDLMNGETMVFVHGHLDNINSIFQNMVGATRKYIRYICLGHYHSGKYKEFQGCSVIVNGSIVGTEGYALSKRLFGCPSQTLLIFEGENLLDCRINLNIQE